MSMKLYNTLTRKIENVQPLNAPIVTVYTCGPTVYDYPHVGNWFTFIRYDLLIRTLRLSKLQPKWVMNITDVGHLVSDADEGQDKLEKSAIKEGKTAWDIANLYSDYFIKGLGRLNFTQPTFLPRATEHIADQINLAETLENKGYTYLIDDGLYYDTSKFPQYANFARLDLDEQQFRQRIASNHQKRQQTDFALWKLSPKTTKRDMEWKSPWGNGFPGWHLECSAMALKYLGATIDIHSGGLDHIPVHHTNEIAQSEGATNQRLASLWMHTNYVLVDNQKISKSLGNGITLEDIESRGFSLEAFRLLVLQSHYRTQSHFSWDELEAAQKRLSDLRALAALVWQVNDPKHRFTGQDQILDKIQNALVDDLNTPLALADMSQFVSGIMNEIYDVGKIGSLRDVVHLFDKAFGLKLGEMQDIDSTSKQAIAEREKARQSKDWKRSDAIRDHLQKQGISINDSNRGPIWYWS